MYDTVALGGKPVRLNEDQLMFSEWNQPLRTSALPPVLYYQLNSTMKVATRTVDWIESGIAEPSNGYCNLVGVTGSRLGVGLGARLIVEC